MSTLNVLQDGTVELERVVTTSLVGDEGNKDTIWTDIMSPKVASSVRYEFNTYIITSTYPTRTDKGSHTARQAAVLASTICAV